MIQLRSLVLSASLFLALDAGAGAAFAADVDASYDGTWTARLPCRNGAGQCRARVVLSDFAGTWQDAPGSPKSQRMCGGKKMPLTVQASTASRLIFTVFGDGVSPDCPTLSILVKPVNAKALAGTFESGPFARDLEDDADAPGAPGAKPASAPNGGRQMPIRLERR